MPKELIHWKIADNTLSLLENSEFKESILRNKNYFLLGTVFPDTLLYGITKNQRDFISSAKYIHNNNNDSFDFLKKAVELNRDNFAELAVFIAGIIIHLEADALFHPAVYYFSGGSAKTHYLLEAALDIRFASDEGRKYSMKSLLKKTEKNLLFSISENLLDFFKIERRKIEGVFKIHTFVQSIFNSKFWQLVVRFIDRFSGGNFDWAELFYHSDSVERASYFLNSDKYIHPVTGEVLTLSFESLFNESAARSAEIINKLAHHRQREEFGEILAQFIGKNPSTGLPAGSEQEMKYFRNQ